MKKLTLEEFQLYLSQVKAEILSLHQGQFLSGMKMGLNENEMRSLAFLRASLMIWNKRGMLTKDWLDKIDLELLEEDSFPDVE